MFKSDFCEIDVSSTKNVCSENPNFRQVVLTGRNIEKSKFYVYLPGDPRGIHNNVLDVGKVGKI